MSDETFLDKAVSNYRLAVKNYVCLIGDERELNLVGYLLQQSLEVAIKHFLEISGIRYKELCIKPVCGKIKAGKSGMGKEHSVNDGSAETAFCRPAGAGSPAN